MPSDSESSSSRSASPEPKKRARLDTSPRKRSPSPKVEERRPAEAARSTEVAKKDGGAEPVAQRTGGAYIPPARLRMMQQEAGDKSSVEFQRLAWNALKKSLNGIINKVNVGNLGNMVPEVFQENLVRGRGLFTRTCMRAQTASPNFTNVYAALVSVVNTKFPQIGELLLKRLVLQCRRAFKRNDKPTLLNSVRFVAHLVNQKVAHEVLALEIVTLFLEKPTNDSVETAIAFLKECGMYMTEVSPRGLHAVFERMRTILHEGEIEKRVQYMIEVLFAVRKDGFKDFVTLPEGLDLVEESDQITHLVSLDDVIDPEDKLDVFQPDPDYLVNEEKYKEIRNEILGDGGSEDGGDEEESDDEEEEAKEEGAAAPAAGGNGKMQIKDMTATNLVTLRRTIYLTIMSSLDFEECAHKLLKMTVQPGIESELCHMLVDCCSQERSYLKFYGLLAERFCNINQVYREEYSRIFAEQYTTVHRLDTNKLRQVAKLFAHLLYTDALPWSVLEIIRLNESDTTSSSRIYIKELLLEVSQYMGLPKMIGRFRDPYLAISFQGLFPRDSPKNTRFSINFFTSIGLGALTDDMREFLKQAPKAAPLQPPPGPMHDGSSSGSSSSSSDSESDSGSSSSSSSASSAPAVQKRADSRSPPRRGSPARRRSPSPDRRRRSPSPARRSRSPVRRTTSRRSPSPARRNRSPPRRAAAPRSRSRSASPVARDRSRSPPRRSPPRRKHSPPAPRRSSPRHSPRRSPPRRNRSRSPRRSRSPVRR